MWRALRLSPSEGFCSIFFPQIKQVRTPLCWATMSAYCLELLIIICVIGRQTLYTADGSLHAAVTPTSHPTR